jgi:ABC-type transport system involved in cytochrome bd biosynthesis fused ATPase/permease subunit
MNLNILHSARKVLTGVAIAVVALVIGLGISSPASSHQHAGVSQATKEWKPRATTTTTDVVSATKEWKLQQPSTKEW